ncbi:MAG: hypothetical protein WDW36_005778 [Sanguina aurantia]
MQAGPADGVSQPDTVLQPASVVSPRPSPAPSLHSRQQAMLTPAMEYDLESMSSAELLAAAQQRNISRNITDPFGAILSGIPERAKVHETAIRVYPFSLPGDVNPNAYVRPWKVVLKRAAQVAAVDIPSQSSGSAAMPLASSSIASKLLAAGGARAKQAAADAVAALPRPRLHDPASAADSSQTHAGSAAHPAVAAGATGPSTPISTAAESDPALRHPGSVGGLAAHAPATLHRKAPAMSAALPADQLRFNAALAGFLGMTGGRLDLPLLAPNAPLLDLRRLFLEVIERGGCSNVYGSSAWSEVAKLLQRDASLGRLLGDVYRWLLLPVEAALPSDIRPARVLEWLEGRSKARLERTEPQPSPVAVSSALAAAEQGILQWDEHHHARSQPSDLAVPGRNGNSGNNRTGNTTATTIARDEQGCSMAEAAVKLLLQLAARPRQFLNSLVLSGPDASTHSSAAAADGPATAAAAGTAAAAAGSGAAATAAVAGGVDGAGVGAQQPLPGSGSKRPGKPTGKSAKGAEKRRKSVADATDGMVSPAGVVDTQEQLEVLIPDAEVSALLDAPTPTQHLKSKLASVVEAVDLDLLLDPHPSSFGHPAPVRAVASVAKSAATNLLLSTLQTGLSPRKSHQPIASGGAAPAAKKRLSDSPTVAAKKRLSDPQMVAAQKRLSDPQTVAASLQDPSMIPHLSTLLYSFRQHQCTPAGCGAPIPDIRAAFRQRLAMQELEQTAAAAPSRLTATTTTPAGSAAVLQTDSAPAVPPAPLSSSLFRAETSASAKPKGHTRPSIGSWDISLVQRNALAAGLRPALQKAAVAAAAAVAARLSGGVPISREPAEG